MCDITFRYQGDEAIGYKIVIVDENGDYWSAAMGFKYKKKGKVPVVQKQKRLSSYFRPDILTSYTNNKEMIGRSSVILSKDGANKLSESMTVSQLLDDNLKVAVKKVKVTEDLMEGYYGPFGVIAGRHLEFLD